MQALHSLPCRIALRLRLTANSGLGVTVGVISPLGSSGGLHRPTCRIPFARQPPPFGSGRNL